MRSDPKAHNLRTLLEGKTSKAGLSTASSGHAGQTALRPRAIGELLASLLVRPSGDSTPDPLARLDALVVIAEDLSQHVLFLQLDDGFLPARPSKRLKRGN